MRHFVMSALLLVMLLTSPLHSPAPVRQRRNVGQPLELRISGPRLIHRGDSLKFDVALINRSGEPLALRFPQLFDDPTRFTWSITDTSGRRLSPESARGLAP